jgi:hypothetical protein
MQTFVGFGTLEHATYSCACDEYGLQCRHAVSETFRVNKLRGCEGRKLFHVSTWAPDTHTYVTMSVGNTVLPFC